MNAGILAHDADIVFYRRTLETLRTGTAGVDYLALKYRASG